MTNPSETPRCQEDSGFDDERCGEILVNDLCPIHDRDIYPSETPRCQVDTGLCKAKVIAGVCGLAIDALPSPAFADAMLGGRKDLPVHRVFHNYDGRCDLPLDTPVEGPCVTCGWANDEYAPYHTHGTCEICGTESHPYQPPLGCAVHGAATDGGREV